MHLRSRTGQDAIARIVAREWQTDGYLKPGKIVGRAEADDR